MVLALFLLKSKVGKCVYFDVPKDITNKIICFPFFSVKDIKNLGFSWMKAFVNKTWKIFLCWTIFAVFFYATVIGNSKNTIQSS